MTTVTPPPEEVAVDEITPPAGRDEAAQAIKKLLTNEPKSEYWFAKQLGYKYKKAGKRRGGNYETTVVHDALRVLDARHEAKRCIGGWTKINSRHEQIPIEPIEFEYPFETSDAVPFDEMFVDSDYQRPLTSFAERIEKYFDPSLFGTLTLSDRGEDYDERGGRRYAIIDGQTRWYAAQRRGGQTGPAIVFVGLSPEDESNIFWRLQKERRGIISFYRFRAQLRSGDEEAKAINNLVEVSGFKLGDGTNELRAVAALEVCYRRNDFLLERTLAALKAAWPDKVPEGKFIRGVHYFFMHYPVDNKKRKAQEVDDERLVRRLAAAGPDGLIKKRMSAREIMKGTPDMLMAMAIQSAYLSGA